MACASVALLLGTTLAEPATVTNQSTEVLAEVRSEKTLVTGIDGGAWMEDYLNGRFLTPPPDGTPPSTPCSGTCGSHSATWGQLYRWDAEHKNDTCSEDFRSQVGEYEPWFGFVHMVGLSVNPFTPTFDDEVNLSSDGGIVLLSCQVTNDVTNASNFAIWLWHVYNGTIAGGWGYGIVMFAASMVPIGYAVSAGKALLGQLAKSALAKGVSRALVNAELVAGKAAIRAAGQSAVGESARLAQVAVENSGKILQQEGGAVARAARAQELITKEAEGLRAAMGLPATKAVYEVIQEGIDTGVLKATQVVEAVAPHTNGFLVKVLGVAGVKDPEAIRLITAAWADPKRGPQAVKAALRALDEKGLESESAFLKGDLSNLKGWLGERFVFKQYLTDPEVIRIEKQVTGAISKGRNDYVPRRDFIITKIGGEKFGVEVKHTTSKYLIDELGPAIKKWQNGKRITIGENRLVKQAVLGPRLDELQGLDGTIWRMPHKTYDELLPKWRAGGDDDVLGFLEAQGITVEPFANIDIEPIALATGFT